MTTYILLLRPYQWLKNVFAILDVSIIATAFMNESSLDVGNWLFLLCLSL